MNVTELLNLAVSQLSCISCDDCPMYKACMKGDDAICNYIGDALEMGGKDD